MDSVYVSTVHLAYCHILIIVSSHALSPLYEDLHAGNNSVSVLANSLSTLLYTNVLRLVIIIIMTHISSSTILEYPDRFKKRLWLYDGNLEFLKGKYIGLFVVAIPAFSCSTVCILYSFIH